jgi:2-amino-4-hydroxy-6-hydroxymethyldihydropteridine diphosphokinase
MIRAAMDAIEQSVLTDVTRSSLWSTEPVGYTDQPRFVNAAVAGSTTRTAAEVHTACKDIETRLGRRQRERWREREIDIDVILVGDEVVDDGTLHIPHPRMAERRFVLAPCAEIAPDMRSPLHDRTIAELLASCPDTSDVERLG